MITPSPANRKKILVIDDESAIVTYLTTLLEDEGYETCSAGDIQEGLAMVRERRPDLITLDIRMPGASGLEILSMLRNMSPHAVIALVSGYFTDPMPGVAAGCADVLISKPVSLDTLSGLLDGADQIGRAHV